MTFLRLSSSQSSGFFLQEKSAVTDWITPSIWIWLLLLKIKMFDCSASSPIKLSSANSIRPWQHTYLRIFFSWLTLLFYPWPIGLKWSDHCSEKTWFYGLVSITGLLDIRPAFDTADHFSDWEPWYWLFEEKQKRNLNVTKPDTIHHLRVPRTSV